MLLMLLAFFADRLNVLAVRPVGSGVVTLAVRRVGLADTSSDVLKAGVVINRAKNSGLMVEVFGEAGKHPRSAVGMAGFPHADGQSCHPSAANKPLSMRDPANGPHAHAARRSGM